MNIRLQGAVWAVWACLFGLVAHGDEAHVRPKAWITPPGENTPPYLVIETQIEVGWHIYSLTTPKGGPARTKIKLKGEFLARPPEFQAVPKPLTRFSDAFNLEVEEHAGRVTFFAPLELKPGVDLAQLKLEGSVHAQACNEVNCLIPTDYKFTAALDVKKSPPRISSGQ